ncbi:MAG: hypothetical protein J6V06_06255 [Clostridia bacterium]|nr:hypothetical protein [Clostridia bacterium]
MCKSTTLIVLNADSTASLSGATVESSDTFTANLRGFHLPSLSEKMP